MTDRDVREHPPARTAATMSARISAGHLLVVLRRNRIPCSIDSFSAGGWTARLGELGNGPYSQHGCFLSRQAAAEWLLEEVQRRGAVALLQAVMTAGRSSVSPALTARL
jgi:hypothetical protein